MKRFLPHILSLLCGLTLGCTTYCALDLLMIVGMALDQYPRFTLFLFAAFLLMGTVSLALVYLALRLWNRYEPKRWTVILYAVEIAILLLPGMWACERILAWLQQIFS